MSMPKMTVRDHSIIRLGKQGENEVLQVIWRGIVPEWEEKYGAGEFQLAVRRNQDTAPYIANIELDGGDIVWTITSAETARVGDGECELTYTVGDSIAKSQIWTITVCESLTGQEPVDPPEPAKNWVDVVIKTASDAKQSAAESAESARQSAESATNAAESATKAENAVGHSPIVGENGNWFVWDFAKSEYVDSGKSASTPPITPDTAGKYLTNDGSKAEWGARVVESIERFDTNELLHVASSGVTAIIKKEGNANSVDMVFPVIAQLDGIISHGSGFMRYLDAHGDHYVGSFSLVGGRVGVPKLTFSNTILYVTITQDGEDSSGNPIYKSDKTYEEIKSAHEAWREVKIARAGLFKGITLFTFGVGDFLLLDVNENVASFFTSGVPFPSSLTPPYATGGLPVGVAQINIYRGGEVRVGPNFDPATGEWIPLFINKLPQQYVINVTAGADGTLTADWTFEDIKTVSNAYRTRNGGQVAICAIYNNRIHCLVTADGGMTVFTDTTSEGISILTLSQKDGEDVWTHEVVPLGIPPVPVTTADNGKFLRVVDGQWAADSIVNAKGVNF